MAEGFISVVMILSFPMGKRLGIIQRWLIVTDPLGKNCRTYFPLFRVFWEREGERGRERETLFT